MGRRLNTLTVKYDKQLVLEGKKRFICLSEGSNRGPFVCKVNTILPKPISFCVILSCLYVGILHAMSSGFHTNKMDFDSLRDSILILKLKVPGLILN